MVSPTFAVTKTYGLGYGGLILTRVTSQIPDGTKERSIQISSPKDGDKVTGSIQVKGSMPIGPFENNLAYHITDPSGNEIGVGPFMVNAAEPGAPATFDNALDISALPKGKILFQLVEVSMADGSIISLDAVELVVK
jgi:hypothetical protein